MPSWRIVRPWILVVCLGVYVGLIGMVYRTWPIYERSPDWRLWNALPDALAAGHLYVTATEAPFIWSPVAAWFMQLVPSIYWPWLLAHVAVVFLLRDWRLIVLVFLSWGFWSSTASGAPFAFVFVAGALGLRGSRPAALIYIALCLLMPRPVQLPLMLWLLWKQPEVRWPAIIVFATHAIVVWSTGYADDWIGALVSRAQDGGVTGDFGPTALIGAWWLVIGLPLGAWLFRRGYVGLAGLAISPYWLPEYLMLALLDIVPGWKREPVARGHAQVELRSSNMHTGESVGGRPTLAPG
jgi:hypothetical protein